MFASLILEGQAHSKKHDLGQRNNCFRTIPELSCVQSVMTKNHVSGKLGSILDGTLVLWADAPGRSRAKGRGEESEFSLLRVMLKGETDPAPDSGSGQVPPPL